MEWLSEDPFRDPVIEASGGYATQYFFAFLELADTNQQHFHIQRRRNRVYPPV